MMTRTRDSRIVALCRLWSIAVLGVPFATSSCSDTDDKSNTIAIGLLLPYSGTGSGTSANFERAAIYATSRVNAAGGVHGKRLRIVAGDTHSNMARSVESAQRLISEGVVVVLGTESSDIATALEPTFFQSGVTLLSPLVGIADDALVSCTDRWFRLAPSARTLGEALAKHLSTQAVPSVVILTEVDAYSKAFSDAVDSRFASLGGTVALRVEIDASAQSYNQVLQQVVASGTDTIVLATSPRTGALIVNEFFVTMPTPPRWYLSPLLKTDLLVQNVAPAALNGARGVAPKIYETTDTFSKAFQSRWEGDTPLEGAYFYYDSVALVAYALQAAAPGGADGGAAETLKQSILNVSATRGEPSGWDEIERGLQSLSAGRSVYYAGVTGPALLDTCGARKIGTFATWSVQAGQIVNDSTE